MDEWEQDEAKKDEEEEERKKCNKISLFSSFMDNKRKIMQTISNFEEMWHKNWKKTNTHTQRDIETYDLKQGRNWNCHFDKDCTENIVIFSGEELVVCKALKLGDSIV